MVSSGLVWCCLAEQSKLLLDKILLERLWFYGPLILILSDMLYAEQIMSEDLVGKTMVEVLYLHSNLHVGDTITEVYQDFLGFAKTGRGLGFLRLVKGQNSVQILFQFQI